VAQERHAIGQGRSIARERIARPRQRRAAEVERAAIGAAHQLDDVRIEQFFGRRDRRRQRRHRRVVLDQRLRDRADAARGRERFVALQVDDDRVVRPAKLRRDFGQTVAARSVIGARHRHAHAAAGERRFDARIVGGDDHLARTRGERAPRDMQHHRLASDRQQRFSRQARGAEARGNGDDE
jgi:hypothetical protein